MNIYIKFLPIFYTFLVVKKGNFLTVLWYFYKYLLFPFLSFVVLYISKGNYLNFFIILKFFFYYLIYISIYEIGNILNDTVTVRFEKNPTKRVENISFKLLLFFIFIRIVLLVITILFIRNIYFLFALLLTIFVFLIHDFIRNFWVNFLTFCLLRLLKFLVVFTFYNLFDKEYIIIFILLFGLYYFDELVGYIFEKLKYNFDKEILLYRKNIFCIILITKNYVFFVSIVALLFINYFFVLFFFILVLDFFSLFRNYNIFKNLMGK